MPLTVYFLKILVFVSTINYYFSDANCKDVIHKAGSCQSQQEQIGCDFDSRAVMNETCKNSCGYCSLNAVTGALHFFNEPATSLCFCFPKNIKPRCSDFRYCFH